MGYSSLMQRLSWPFARDFFITLSQVSQVSQPIFPHLQLASKPCLNCPNCPNGFSTANYRYIHGATLSQVSQLSQQFYLTRQFALKHLSQVSQLSQISYHMLHAGIVTVPQTAGHSHCDHTGKHMI